MVNAWSLLYDEINGTLDEEYPIMTEKNENYDEFENPNPEQYNFTSSNVTEAKTEKDWQDFWRMMISVVSVLLVILIGVWMGRVLVSLALLLLVLLIV